MLENKVGIQAVGVPVTDDVPATTTILPGEGLAMFTINANDPDMRYISVASSVEIRTWLIPTNAIYQQFIEFDSVDPRIFSMIGWHFIPGIEYQLFVFPKTIPTTPTSVTVSMSKSGGGFNWVYNQNGQSFEEKNILTGGNTEVYGFAFQTAGRYRFTVTTGISKLYATFSDGRNPGQGEVKPSDGVSFSSQYVFEKTIAVTGSAQNDYALTLYSMDTPGSGAPYTIAVQRIG